MLGDKQWIADVVAPPSVAVWMMISGLVLKWGFIGQVALIILVN